jgi:hypothetical protein
VQRRPGLAELNRRLADQTSTVTHRRSVIRFFSSHRWLLADPRFARVARARLAVANASLERAKRRLAALRSTIAARERSQRRPAKLARPAKPKRERLLASTRAMTPQEAICNVFGGHCREALAVARCESRYQTSAQNGQYLGLFQMGDWARSNYGHGPTALAQAEAAYRLFVDTGKTWQQWSCQP